MEEANPEHVEILMQGAEAVAAWQKKNAPLTLQLARAVFRGANLRSANLGGAKLRGADLRHANLGHAKLGRAMLNGADLADAYLAHAFLRGAFLRGANLGRANLRGAGLAGAKLKGAKLKGTDLVGANIRHADLAGADLSDTTLGGTVFANVDLSGALGLESVEHVAPSTVGIDTLKNSRGKIPEDFLRGCGLAEWEVEAAKLYDPDLTPGEITDIHYKVIELRAGSPVQINPLFISYSHDDAAFVDAIEELLNERRIRYWRDVHDLTSGKIEKQIEHAMATLNPTVLIVLSERSVESNWVEWEVEEASRLEKKTGCDVLCPIALDDSWQDCSWSKPLRNQIQKYNILSFGGWQDENRLREQFEKLNRGLRLFYERSDDGES